MVVGQVKCFRTDSDTVTLFIGLDLQVQIKKIIYFEGIACNRNVPSTFHEIMQENYVVEYLLISERQHSCS